MDRNLEEEKEILFKKRIEIRKQLNVKIKNQENIDVKLKSLTKEARGSYSEEKETTQKIFEVLKKDIQGYEEALSNPYFGRVDFREARGGDEQIYIGKKGVSSLTDGEEIVVDWRAPVADLYYSGTGGYAYYKSPVGVIEGNLSLKRKFLYKDNELIKLFDEGINEIIINDAEGTDLVDEFLKINLEESRGKKLKEVVSTIQKEQNDIIRWPKNLPIIVQGSAGSGKTTIALHRLAYLLYRYAGTMKGKDILVLAPNKLFLNYISEILPNLGVDEVCQTTFHELLWKKLRIKGKLKNKDEKIKELIEIDNLSERVLIEESSRLKGSLEFKDIIDRYISILEGDSLDVNDIKNGEYILFYKKEILRLFLKDLKHFPINKRKDEIKRYLNLKLKERIQILCAQIDSEWDEKIKNIKMMLDDNEKRRKKLIVVYEERDNLKSNLLNNSKKVMNEYFHSWRGITPKDIYFNLLSNSELLSLLSLGSISDNLSEFIKCEISNNKENGIIDEDDLAAMLYINFLLEGVSEKDKFLHIVVDEAQDYSQLQILVINKLSKGNSLTLVGDLAQGIYYYKGISAWEDITKGVFDGKATYMQLSQSYRSTVEIIGFARKALNSQNLGLKPAIPVLRHGEIPKVIKCNSEKESVETISKLIYEIKSKGKQSVAIITKTLECAISLGRAMKKNYNNKCVVVKGKEKEVVEEIIIIPSYLTKGLEFDGVIIYDPSIDNYGHNLLDQRLLYVSLTRALHFEYIIAINNLCDMI